MAFKLQRRAFLSGAAGAAVALPCLEIMGEASVRADTVGSPCRYLVVYTGFSIKPDSVVPITEGSGYALTPGLGAFAGRQIDTVAPGLEFNERLKPTLDHDDVTNEWTIISGLKIPWQTTGDVPAAGRIAGFHGSTQGPILTGTRAIDRAVIGGPSSDQIVAEAFAAGTRFRSLEYAIQAAGYVGDGDALNPHYGRMSYVRDSSGELQHNMPIISPRVAYDQLFRGFEGEDPVLAARRRIELSRDRSVLDLVRGSSDRLMSRLGVSDRRRMDRYFTEVRDLERRVREIPDTAGASCGLLPDPGEDPRPSGYSCDGEECQYGAINGGWADEDARARFFADLITMALSCDLTRVSTLLMTDSQSFLQMEVPLGIPENVHGITHGYIEQNHHATAWHLKHLSYLVHKLRSTPEGDGNLLDHTVLTFLAEGGWGYDPEGGTSDSSHSSENMVAFVAGGAGGLRGGRHIVAYERHPASVLISSMQAVGVPINTLGEVTGGIDGLLP